MSSGPVVTFLAPVIHIEFAVPFTLNPSVSVDDEKRMGFRRRHLRVVSFLVSLVLWPNLGYAESMTLSIEHNVSNADIRFGPFSKKSSDLRGEFKYHKILVDYITAHCPKCVKTPHDGKWGKEYHFKFPSGYGFNVAIDLRTIEVQPDPDTNEEFRDGIEERRFLYRAYEACDLHPSVELSKDEKVRLYADFKKAGIPPNAYAKNLELAYNSRMFGNLNFGTGSAFADDGAAFGHR